VTSRMSLCRSSQDHLSYFRFVGRVIGLAVMHGLQISGGFTLPLYRLLLGKKITLNDIESVDPDLYRSFVWIMYARRRRSKAACTPETN